jgi:mRNA interferase RelE/StbE
MFEVILERLAEKDLRKLSRQVHDRVVSAILALADDPRPPAPKKLSGSRLGWRLRLGD